jgi:nucleotide-binding universal stress UspA family protein
MIARMGVESTMRVRTVLVGTDLTERSDQAMLRGHQLAAANDAKLVVCHVGPGHVGSHPLFPQRHQDDVVSAANLDERIAEAVSARAADVTGRSPEQFDVVVDQGDVATVLNEQALRLDADLIVVMADGSDPDAAGTVTRDLARISSCSVFAVGEGAGTGVAVVALEGELEMIPDLVSAARSVLAAELGKVDVVLLVDDRKLSTSQSSERVTNLGAEMGVVLVPWFAEIGDRSLLARAVGDASLGLVVMAAPVPDNLTAATSSPLDEALSSIRSSVLLLRTS